MNKLKIVIIILFFVSFITVRWLQAEPAVDTVDVTKLVTEKQCLTCHKPFSSLNTPRLHGAKKEYLIKQLKNFKDGHRKNVTMSGVAQKLSEAEMEILATHFSSFNKCEVSLKEETGPGDPVAGEKLSEKCIVCHGENKNIGAPILDTQNGYYIANQLRSLKYGQRENPLMIGVVKDLSEQDILDLAAYFSSKNDCVPAGQSIQFKSLVTWSLPRDLLGKLEIEAKNKSMDLNQYIQQILEAGFKDKK